MLMTFEVVKLWKLSFFVQEKLKFKSFTTSQVINVTFQDLKVLHDYT